MIELIRSIDRVLTWRRLAMITIPVIWLASFSDISTDLIVYFGFCGVIASVLSLRGQEGDA